MESQSVRDAVERRLDELPDDVARSATAAAALALADSIDLGTEAYRFQSALVGQLRECMAELDAKAPAKDEGDTVDELNRRRAARRSAAAAG
jgi:hypothetical protein